MILYRWGSFNGEENEHPQICLVSVGLQILEVACGSGHALILCNDSNVFSWGDASAGQCGNGFRGGAFEAVPKGVTALAKLKVKSVAAMARRSMVLTSTGEVYAFGDNTSHLLGVMTRGFVGKPLSLDALLGVVSIFIGPNSAGAINKNGDLYMWGHNSVSRAYSANH